ncbi:hypothetical protein PPIS_a4594 [Pseudoalteromonas piscicida]|uniref:Uncharacterized protein n=1 Tax=Pseudoalteromonas piscicida TaxID=43662 RepID=A0ABN5CQD8_PSEO7|nr:hypothetical protein PPIS_a4594 [Pseudoalteromonas piscicida]
MLAILFYLVMYIHWLYSLKKVLYFLGCSTKHLPREIELALANHSYACLKLPISNNIIPFMKLGLSSYEMQKSEVKYSSISASASASFSMVIKCSQAEVIIINDSDHWLFGEGINSIASCISTNDSSIFPLSLNSRERLNFSLISSLNFSSNSFIFSTY